MVKLDEGYFILRTLRNSPAYLEKRKTDVFAMIRQLGFSRTSRFLSLSFNLMSGSSLVYFLALQSFSFSFALNSIFSRASRILSLSFTLISRSSLVNFLEMKKKKIAVLGSIQDKILKLN
jgi:hypothetical protein